MAVTFGVSFDPGACPSPSYVCDLERLESNLRILASVQDRTGAKILLALKGFALWSTFDLCRKYLRGTTASSLHEAMLGSEEFGGETHIFSPAYVPADMPEILRIADHIVFNSHAEVDRWREAVARAPRSISCGLRINPGYSEVATELYNPCARFSRLGVPLSELREDALSSLDGLHFHSLCGQNSDVLERTVAIVERDFGHLFDRMRWLNFGGGHHITRPDYDVDRLCGVIERIRERYGVDVYLEPGEAIGLDTGVLVATVLDVVRNEMEIAILDTSATAHMPDVLEMPYRPEVLGAGLPGEHPFTYRLGGLSCLAGDVIGDYSFPAPLRVGERLVFRDMIHYTMVKTTTFNGVRLPSIVLWDPRRGELREVRRFGYEDYKGRLS